MNTYVDPDEEPITLRDGQKYVRNDGKVILVRSMPMSPSGHCFIDKANNNSYDAHGIHDDRALFGEEDEWNIAGPYVAKEKR
jgi:hypothetical protein